jgi:hypothetical protein
LSVDIILKRGVFHEIIFNVIGLKPIILFCLATPAFAIGIPSGKAGVIMSNFEQGLAQ